MHTLRRIQEAMWNGWHLPIHGACLTIITFLFIPHLFVRSNFVPLSKSLLTFNLWQTCTVRAQTHIAHTLHDHSIARASNYCACIKLNRMPFRRLASVNLYRRTYTYSARKIYVLTRTYGIAFRHQHGTLLCTHQPNQSTKTILFD